MQSEDEARELRAVLIKRRQALGISQRELAVRMDTVQSHVSELEAGVDAQMSTWIKWADALGLTMRISLMEEVPHATVRLRTRPTS